MKRIKRTLHGYYKHPLYKVWSAIRERCINKNCSTYEYYGGRGIDICNDWLNNPRAFIEWALCHGWEKGLQIDRIDNDGNYQPSNCRFVTRGDNARNVRLIRKNNTTGYRGVYKKGYYSENPFVAGLSVNSKTINLGCFSSPVLAALRYDAEAYKLNDGRPTNFFSQKRSEI